MEKRGGGAAGEEEDKENWGKVEEIEVVVGGGEGN